MSSIVRSEESLLSQSHSDASSVGVVVAVLTPYLSKKAHFGSGRWKNFKSGNHPFKLSFLPLDAPSSELPFDITRILVGLEMIDCRSIEAP